MGLITVSHWHAWSELLHENTGSCNSMFFPSESCKSRGFICGAVSTATDRTKNRGQLRIFWSLLHDLYHMVTCKYTGMCCKLQPDSQSYTFVERIGNRETEATKVKLGHLQTHHKVQLFWALSTIQRDKLTFSEPSTEAAASKQITLNQSPLQVSVCCFFSLLLVS